MIELPCLLIMRLSSQKINPTLNSQIVATFAQTLADFKTKERMVEFLGDFLTASELELFTKRLGVIYYLAKGRSYTNIKTNLKVSSATIAAAASAMKKSGIKQAIKLMEAEEWANKWVERFSKLTR